MKTSVQASLWSDLPSLIHHYFTLIDAADGVMRIFGYASLIARHTELKLSASQTLPNERARLRDMEVNMNLLTEKLFAGLEPSPGNFAEGIAITIAPKDRKAALEAFIKRELGVPPWGTGIIDIYEGKSAPFDKVKNSPKDHLKKYKLIVAGVEIPTFDGIKEVPALAVITHPDLKTSLIGKSPSYLCELLRQDRQSYDYFIDDAITPARSCAMRQKRLEAIEILLRGEN